MFAPFPSKTVFCLSLLLLLFCLTFPYPTCANANGADDGPALARLSFWLPPERMAEFAAAYEGDVLPILKQHGVVESSQRGRATVDSVFSRLFALRAPAEAVQMRVALGSDTVWQETIRTLGDSFGTTPADSLLRYSFMTHDTPAGRGKVVRAGPGYRQGHWHSFGAQDGLPPAPIVSGMLQASDGNLWIPTQQGAVRYDGAEFVTYTADDGLAPTAVLSVFEDRDGNLWFATIRGGISKYDGHRFTTFSAEDGLAGNEMKYVWQDAQGVLWVATAGGVSHYDGQRFHPLEALNAVLGSDLREVLVDCTGALWVSTDESGVCRYDEDGVTVLTEDDGLAHNHVWSMLEARDGSLWFCTAEGLSRYEGERFATFTSQDGLSSNEVFCALQDRRGDLWFSTKVGPKGGITHYDGERFAPAGAAESSGAMLVEEIHEDRQGNLWFLVYPVGVVRYDGHRFVRFTTEDGLANGQVNAYLEDRKGNLWFGTWSGISRYDGSLFATFTTREGLPSNGAMSLLQDAQGRIWVGTWDGVCWYDDGRMIALEGSRGQNVYSIVEDRHGRLWFGGAFGGGASRHDGEDLVTFTTEEGLPDDRVAAIMEDRAGHMWFVSYNGLATRYDGREFEVLGAGGGQTPPWVSAIHEDRNGVLWLGGWGQLFRRDKETSLVRGVDVAWEHEMVQCIYEDREGVLWFGAIGGGIGRYDRDGFTTPTTDDGLGDDRVMCILQDDRGTMWFGTGSGVCRYDGLVFQRLSRHDGLVHDTVQDILQTRDGVFWIATEGGVTRYHPSRVAPRVQVTGVVANSSYGAVSRVVVPSSQRILTFEFEGGSFTTSPDRMAYAYRLAGYDEERHWTRSQRVEYSDLPRGEYTFRVWAVDRDLNYSERPDEVLVTVHLDAARIALQVGLAVSLVGLALTSAYGIRRRRDQRRAERALMREMEAELEDARRMQLSLMPTAAPDVPGVSVSGWCVSANHVGGDFFQYFEREDGLAISLADVTGHAMEAAIPAVMFSGILDTRMEAPKPLEELFRDLNGSLVRSLGEHAFVCLSMVDIEPGARAVRVANCGCPYPLHYRAATGEIEEIQVVAYALGIRSDTEYTAKEVALSPGDYVVLHSDGFSEAANAQEQLFGFDRTMEVIRQGCSERLSPEELIEKLIGEVKAFTGDEPQADDMTCVVVKVET